MYEVEDPRSHAVGKMCLTPLGQDLYRVEGQPLGVLCGVNFRDTVHLRRSDEGKLVFVRRVEKSPWRTLSFMISRGLETADLTSDLEEMGCVWEKVMGGLFFVHTPPEADALRVRQRLEADGFQLESS